jgi:cytochrome b561
MVLRNTTQRWGWPSKALHWLGALAILVLLAHGWWMTHLAPRPERLANYAWHAALGYDLLVLTIVRLLWRWLNPVPALPADAASWERAAAHLGHFGLYLVMLAVSLTGWALAGTFRVPMGMDLLGIPVPALAADAARGIREWLEETHKVLAYILAALVGVHIVGALRHHWMKKNEILRRMTWGGAPSPRG